MSPSIKSNLLNEIDKKIKDRREKKENSIDPKDYRAAVFDFFRNFEDSGDLIKTDDSWLMMAKRSLLERLSIIDPKCKINIHMTSDNNVSGVTITWNSRFAISHNIDSQVYIDVGDMLLF